MQPIKRMRLLFALAFASLTIEAADVRLGLVSYWPLDTVASNFDWTTPDLVSGNNLEFSLSMTEANLVPGKKDQAVSFDAAVGGQFLLHRLDWNPSSLLPISRQPNWTVMFWVNADFAGQNDRRVYSESSLSVDNPLVNIGTHNASPPPDGTVDIFMRGGTSVAHLHSTNIAYDGTWHHVALTYDGQNLNLFVDGAADLVIPYPAQVPGLNATSVGGIVRQNGANIAALFTGLVDELAIWERALSQSEVQDVMNNSITTPVPAFAPEVVVQPAASGALQEGASVTLSAKAIGTRPFTYQWKKGGSDIADANGETLTLSDLAIADSGAYTVVISNTAGTTTSEAATLTVEPFDPEMLSQDLVSYWPLDEMIGTKTPDIVSGYDMNLVNLTEADVVPGQVGNAFQFSNARQTLLSRVHSAGEDLPINQHESLTIAMWVNVTGTGQNDLRIFSEGSTTSNDPLFNIGTANNGADGSVDFYMRQAGWTLVNHPHSVQHPLDGTWHHIAFIRDAGERRFYVDGVLDDLVLPPKEPGAWLINNTTIGGILRGSASHWVTGLIDDVALWKRALGPRELMEIVENGMPDVGPVVLPLEIRVATSDFPAAAQGDTVVLRWDVSSDATITIEPGLGDVTGISEFGVGQAEVTINGPTTFTLTLTRGTETLSETFTVQAVENVASGWRLIDNFETYTPGPIASTSAWVNPEGLANVFALDGNQALAFDAGNDVNARHLDSLTLPEGERATLFFRAFLSSPDAAAVGINVGLTEKAIRFSGDLGGDIGPFVRIERTPPAETADILTRYGFNGPLEGYGYFPLAPSTVYNVWIDIVNGPLNDFDTGDLFTVYVAAEGATDRTLLFQDYLGDRNRAGSVELGQPKPNLSTLLVAAIGADQGVNTVWLDDFFISTTGAFNATVPTPASSFEPEPPPVDVLIAYEGFDYPAGALPGLNGGTGWGASWQVNNTPTDGAVVQENSLSYTDSQGNSLVTSGGKAFVTGVAGTAQPFRELPAVVGLTPSTSWFSFIGVRTGPTVENVDQPDNPYPRAANVSLFNSTLTSSAEQLAIGSGTAALTKNWYLLPNGSIGVGIPSDEPIDVLSFVVVRIDHKEGNDDAYLWVNPDLDTEPSIASADAQSIASDTGYDYSLNRVRPFAGNTQTANNRPHAELVFDELRLGTTFASVAPFTIGGPVPTISISRAGGQIQITWSGTALESAATVDGDWTEIQGASSPHPLTPTGGQMFFRARQ